MTSGTAPNKPNCTLKRCQKESPNQFITPLRNAVLQLTGGAFLGMVGAMITNWHPKTMDGKGVQEDW